MRLIIYFLVSALVCSPLYAQFRCKGKLIDDTYSKLDVEEICGSPIYKDRYKKAIIVEMGENKKKVNCEEIDQWYYKVGAYKSTYIVEFRYGFVDNIVRGRDKR